MVFEILGGATDCSEGHNPGAFTDPGTAVDHDVRLQPDAIAQLNIWPYDTIWTDGDIRTKFRAFRNNSCGMYIAHSLSMIMAEYVAWATALPGSTTLFDSKALPGSGTVDSGPVDSGTVDSGTVVHATAVNSQPASGGTPPAPVTTVAGSSGSGSTGSGSEVP